MISIADLSAAMHGAEFPTHREELVALASDNNADSATVAAIANLNWNTFESEMDVVDAFAVGLVRPDPTASRVTGI